MNLNKSDKTLEEQKEVWLRAWCSVASSPGGSIDLCNKWADRCLLAFNERFNETE